MRTRKRASFFRQQLEGNVMLPTQNLLYLLIRNLHSRPHSQRHHSWILARLSFPLCAPHLLLLSLNSLGPPLPAPPLSGPPLPICFSSRSTLSSLHSPALHSPSLRRRNKLRAQGSALRTGRPCLCPPLASLLHQGKSQSAVSAGVCWQLFLARLHGLPGCQAGRESC